MLVFYTQTDVLDFYTQTDVLGIFILKQIYTQTGTMTQPKGFFIFQMKEFKAGRIYEKQTTVGTRWSRSYTRDCLAGSSDRSTETCGHPLNKMGKLLAGITSLNPYPAVRNFEQHSRMLKYII